MQTDTWPMAGFKEEEHQEGEQDIHTAFLQTKGNQHQDLQVFFSFFKITKAALLCKLGPFETLSHVTTQVEKG